MQPTKVVKIMKHKKYIKSIIFDRNFQNLMNIRQLIIPAACLLLLSLPAFATSDKEHRLSFAYDADFEMNFDNREFYRSGFSRSMTIFAARLTPSVGLDFQQDDRTGHRLMLGADLMKDFGGKDKDIFREILLYYNFRKDIGDTELSLYAGIFPRSKTQDLYSEAFISDSLAFYDNNIEGILLKFRRPKAEFELGCDWMGQYGADSRERFLIFSSGEGKVAPVLSVGYAAYMYHFANSHVQKGVVDNILLNPWLRFDFGHFMGLQKFSLRLGFLQGMQHDRAYAANFVFPCGGEADLEIRNWNVGIRNDLFYGSDMMPYYNCVDNTGEKYGTRLYTGSPFYRVHDLDSGGAGIYDRFQVFYEPEIGKWLKIRIAALFHFNGQRYSGCQQQVTLKFNLQNLLTRRR